MYLVHYWYLLRLRTMTSSQAYSGSLRLGPQNSDLHFAFCISFCLLPFPFCILQFAGLHFSLAAFAAAWQKSIFAILAISPPSLSSLQPTFALNHPSLPSLPHPPPLPFTPPPPKYLVLTYSPTLSLSALFFTLPSYPLLLSGFRLPPSLWSSS